MMKKVFQKMQALMGVLTLQPELRRLKVGPVYAKYDPLSILM